MSGAGRPIRVATRASRLAMAQTEAVVRRLRAVRPDARFEVVPMTTRGDRLSRERAGAAAAEVGAFVKELEEALLDGRADLAVHSLKDVPTELPPGLTLGAFPEREDPRDVLVLPPGAAAAGGVVSHGPGGAAEGSATQVLARLAPGSRVGTSSQRRGAQLRWMRTDLAVAPVRGNVETRLRRLDEGHFDALVLAGAGLRRLGLEGRAAAWFTPDQLVPAAGQGTLAVECRADDEAALALLAAIDRPELRLAAEAERAFLARTGAGCRWPVGAWATVEGEALTLVGFVAVPAGDGDGAGLWAARERRQARLPRPAGSDLTEALEAARRLGRELADRLLGRIRAGEGVFLGSQAAGGV